MHVKFLVFKVPMENWQTVQMPLGKKSRKISIWLGIICTCKVRMNGSMVFNSDHLENPLKTNSSPGKLEFTDLTPRNSILSGMA